MDEPPANKIRTSPSTIRQVLLGLIINLSNLSPGMTLGFSAVAIPAMQSVTNPERISDTQASWIASTTSIAIPIGCLISGPILDKFGRKLAVQLVNIISIVGWIIIGTAGHAPAAQYVQVLTGRVITGIAVGMSSIPTTVYMSEISTPKLRAMLGSWTSVFIAFGVLIVYILGYFLKDDWRMTSLLAAIFPALSLTLNIFIIPESPHWLVARGNILKAENSLSRIRGVSHSSTLVQEEISLLSNYKPIDDDSEPTNIHQKIINGFKYITKRSCYKPFILMVAFFFFQQFSGTFVIVFYAVSLVTEAGVSMDPYLAAIMIASSRVVGSILVSFVCKRYGRRPPSIVSGSCMTIGMIALAIYLYLVKIDSISTEVSSKLTWLPVALIVFYFFTSTLGFLTIPFIMVAEVFPTKVRGVAGGLTVFLNYMFNFVIIKTYKSMLATMGKHGVFCFYGAMSLLGTVFVVLWLPETKGKTLVEIENYFEGKSVRQSVNDQKC